MKISNNASNGFHIKISITLNWFLLLFHQFRLGYFTFIRSLQNINTLFKITSKSQSLAIIHLALKYDFTGNIIKPDFYWSNCIA